MNWLPRYFFRQRPHNVEDTPIRKNRSIVRNDVQVFISYRREGGAELARLVWEALNRRGYRAFMDVEDLRSGRFNSALYARIDSASDLVVILTPSSLDRCKHEDDWLRLEVSHGIRNHKNIVPVMARGFEWPSLESLPPDLADLPDFQGFAHSHDLFEASMDRLAKLLIARPLRGYQRLVLAAIVLCFLVLVLAIQPLWRKKTVLPEATVGQATKTELVKSPPVVLAPSSSGVKPKPVSVPVPTEATSETALLQNPESKTVPPAVSALVSVSQADIVVEKVAEKRKVLDLTNAGNPALDSVLQDRLYNVPHDFDIRIETVDKLDKYEEGDRVMYRVKADRDCHIAVFCHQADDSSVQLFPNAWNLDTFIMSGRTVEVPGAAKEGFEIVIGPPFGSDVVQVVACTRASELHRISVARAKESPAGPALVSRGMVVKQLKSSISEPATSGSVEWGEGHLIITTRPSVSQRQSK